MPKINPCWTAKGAGAKELCKQYDAGIITKDSTPKDVYDKSSVFQTYYLQTFRNHFNVEKRKRGYNLGSPSKVKKEELSDESDDDDFEELPVIPSTPDVSKRIVSTVASVPQALDSTWYKKNTPYNTYLFSSWKHPSTGSQVLDVMILLPSGASENDMTDVLVRKDGMVLLLTIAWPAALSDLDILTKPAQRHVCTFLYSVHLKAN